MLYHFTFPFLFEGVNIVGEMFKELDEGVTTLAFELIPHIDSNMSLAKKIS